MNIFRNGRFKWSYKNAEGKPWDKVATTFPQELILVQLYDKETRMKDKNSELKMTVETITLESAQFSS